MKEPRVDTIRNVALIGSTGAGKTSLVDAILYTAGVIPSIGSIVNGNTISDFEPEEVHRKVSISSTVAHFSSKEIRFNIVDTPGAQASSVRLKSPCAPWMERSLSLEPPLAYGLNLTR